MSMRNVVIVVLDTVRKDVFDEEATRLSALADAEFERCYAPSSWSVPSHASMLSGELPHVHGAHSYNPDYADLDGTFLDDLDHRAVAVTANGAVSKVFGFDEHFDAYASFAGNDERSPDAMSFKHVEDVDGPARYVAYLREAARRGKFTESLLNGLYVKTNTFLDGRPVPNIGDGGAAAVADKSRSFVDAGDEPYVLFCNFIDAHAPLANRRVLDSSVPYGWSSKRMDASRLRERDPADVEEYLESYRDLYAANVAYLDQVVSTMITDLQRRTQRETVAVVTADHGEELLHPGERDLGHMDFSTPLLHVPFVIVGADAPEATTAGTTSLLDLGEIVESIARGDPVPDVTRERVPAERIGMLFYDGDDEYWRRGVRTVYEDDVRYEWDTLGREAKIEVGVSADGERTVRAPPDRALGSFDGDLDSYVEGARAAERQPDLSRETERQLENLGYKV